MLVLGGASDVIVPPEGIERTARAYGATWKIFPGAAHDLMLEDAWEDVAKYMLEWLEQLPGSAAGLTGR